VTYNYSKGMSVSQEFYFSVDKWRTGRMN